MRERVQELDAFAEEVAATGLDAVVLLGMGGSSLAPEVLRRTFGSESFHVLDTTHPRAIRALEASIDLERTLFVSASKSGVDARDALAHRLLLGARGKHGARFVAVTDPGSELERLAARARLPRTCSRASRRSAAATRRSRRSVSSPAALMGVDVARLLDEAERDGGGLPQRRAAIPATSRARSSARAGRRGATRSASPRRTAASASGPSS